MEKQVEQVAAGSIRQRILKAGIIVLTSSIFFSCSGFDPTEDTESNTGGDCSLTLLKSCSGFDPTEDTESEAMVALRFWPFGSCSGFDPTEDTESVEGDNVVVPAGMSCSGFDPTEDTESRVLQSDVVAEARVAAGSIRQRILKDSRSRAASGKSIRCSGFDPTEDTESDCHLRPAGTDRLLQRVRSDRGY